MPLPISQPFERTAGSYLLDDKDLKGGYRVVATLLERDTIPLAARKLGMIVSVTETSTEYRLSPNLSNASWAPKAPFSGVFVDATELLYVKGDA